MRRSFFGGRLPTGKAAGRGAGLRRVVGPPAEVQALPPWASSPCPRQWFGVSGPPTYRTWCSASRKTLFLHRQAPRLLGPKRRRRMGRGAPLPAKPYSFVDEHHVFRPQGVAGVWDVVLRSPQNLIPSSMSTTSFGPKAAPAYGTWCSASRKTLFLRRQAPRLLAPRRRRRTGRGAPLPASPCSFVVKHHVFGVQGVADVPDVVPHSPQNLVPSSSSTTSLAPDEPTAGLASKK